MVRMRDLVGGGGESDPAKKPRPSRAGVRFPDDPGGRTGSARPETAAVGENPEALFSEIHVLLAELREAVGRGAALPIGEMEAIIGRMIQSLSVPSTVRTVIRTSPLPAR